MQRFHPFSTGAIALLCLLFRPQISAAQFSLNIGYSVEVPASAPLKAIIAHHNQLNAGALVTPMADFNLLSGGSIAIGTDARFGNGGIQGNHVSQIVHNQLGQPNGMPYQTALSYNNTQLGLWGEVMFLPFLGMGGTIDYNFLDINRSHPSNNNYYYAVTNNVFSARYWSYRYQVHFQKMLNPYFAISFRPYYQQSVRKIDFELLNQALERTITVMQGRPDNVPYTPATPQKWTQWGGQLSLRMFLSAKP